MALGPLIGFFGHGYFSLFGAMLAELFPSSVRATAQGFCYNFGRAASALAPFVIGASRTATGSAARWRSPRRSSSRRGSSSCSCRRPAGRRCDESGCGPACDDRPQRRRRRAVPTPWTTAGRRRCSLSSPRPTSRAAATPATSARWRRARARPAARRGGRRPPRLPGPRHVRARARRGWTPTRSRGRCSSRCRRWPRRRLGRGRVLRHVKPHGALYNDAAGERGRGRRGRPRRRALEPGASRWSASPVRAALRGVPRRTASRRWGRRSPTGAYEADGTLRSRALPGALLADPRVAAGQAVRIAVAAPGDHVRRRRDRVSRARTICVHGDSPGAAVVARAVRAALLAAGVRLAPVGRATAHEPRRERRLRGRRSARRAPAPCWRAR